MLSYRGISPRVDESAFIAPGARIIGDVEIGPQASIWDNCVIRGDVNAIRIGARTNIQDGSVIHVDSPKPGRSPGHPTGPRCGWEGGDADGRVSAWAGLRVSRYRKRAGGRTGTPPVPTQT